MDQQHRIHRHDFESLYVTIIERVTAYNPTIDEKQKAYIRKILHFLYTHSLKVFEMRTAVLFILLDFEPDIPTILACLVYELEEELLENIQIKQFVCTDAFYLLEELEQISTIDYQHKRNADIIRRYLLSKVEDVRVLYIRFAKRIGMVQMMIADKFLYTEKKRQRTVHAVQYIIIPFLSHLGLYRVKTRAEDLCFRVTHPKEYQFIQSCIAEPAEKIAKNIPEKSGENAEFIEKIHHIEQNIARVLRTNHIIDVEIFARKKGIYSIYKKIQTKDYHSITDVHDIFALRIITYSVEECYRVLSVLHTAYPHQENHFSDYIATPKMNGYKSIHTVIEYDNHFVEIQIRTQEMDYQAEVGTASHASYKGVYGISKTNKTNNTSNAKGDQSFSALKKSLSAKIYALTPAGEVKELPLGATPLDFAYSIHSDIGDHCSGALVNEKIVSLSYKIQEGDMIGILTDKNKYPKKEWLDLVSSESARQKIKSYLFSIGENILSRVDKTQNKKSENNKEKIVNKNLKNTINTSTKKTQKKPKESSGLIIGGQKNMIHHFAKCCTPEEKKNLVAYASNTRDFIIHSFYCGNIKKLESSRIVHVERIEIEENI